MQPHEQMKYNEFWRLNNYVSGPYDDAQGYQALNQHLESTENRLNANRIFYLALPPTVYNQVTFNIKHNCMSKG